MTLFEHTAQIHRPVEEVVAFLADPTNIPRWQMSLIAARLASAAAAQVARQELAEDALRSTRWREQNPA